jgi:DNA-binding winged helix-turn-helix (wHTH) protein
MIKFGEFILDSKQARLSSEDKELAIEPKLFELLLLFVNQPNTIITRQDILDNLWPGSLVTDNAINKMVANLRKVLADCAKNPRYIQTIPKRGYRLICNVTLLEGDDSAEIKQIITGATRDSNQQRNYLQSKNNKVIIIAFLFLLCSLLLWQVFSTSDKHSSNNGHSMELTRSHGAELSARMHPDNHHLYYLKKNLKKNIKNKLKKPTENTHYELWIKNIDTAGMKQVDIAEINISRIIAVAAGGNNDTTHLFYLDKKQDSCGVYQGVLIHTKQRDVAKQSVKTIQWQQAIKLFDCANKQIKDIDYHVSKNTIYYTAQPQNFWPNQIYAFDLSTKKQSFVTQVEPVGWGHHSIDISPDGNKLLIMSTNNDYKTKLMALNLLNNEITEGFKFDYPVSEAIWDHDSEHIYYYAAAPAHQIIKSDLKGHNATSVVSVTEYLSPQMSLFPDGKNLLFSTEHKNFSNRWLVPPKQVNGIDNSTVEDSNPALFHLSSQYLFISKRSGQRQLYLGRFDSTQAEIVTNFDDSHWLDYIAMSADDENVLISASNKVYLLPMSALNVISPLAKFNQEHLIFTSEHPIISLDWLTNNAAAITTVINGIPELTVVNVPDNKVEQLTGQWAYGLKDSVRPEYSYLIDQQSNTLYRSNLLTLTDDFAINPNKFTKTEISLPRGFFRVKIDANTLYYGSDENGGVYLNAVPLSNINKSRKYLVNDFNSYDVSNGKIILSDIESLEGDVHQTMH